MSTQSATYAASDAEQSRLAALLDEVSTLVESDPARLPEGLSPQLAAEIVRAYYAEVVPEDVLARSADELVAIALGHLDAAMTRTPGVAKVDLRSTSATRATIDIVTDDIPFLVDSVTGEILRRGYAVRFIANPQMGVLRDENDHLVDLRIELGEDAVVESWIHVEVIGPQADQALAELDAGLQVVLADVARAVADWKPMAARAADIASELREAPPPNVSDSEVEETIELLDWLGADHFTFLGYREYRLITIDGVDHLEPLVETGLGLMRTTEKLAPQPLPDLVRAKARERRLLVVTKASSRATVHRTSYLDYVGVKLFNDAGEVIGERRFIGLLTSSTFTQRVASIPIIRRKMAQIVDLAGFHPSSHIAKDLRDVVETFPLEQLFQDDAEKILPVALAVMRLPERRLTRLFLRRDDYGRYYSALVFLSRDRYSTPVRLRMTDILMEELGGTTYDYSTQAGEQPLARLEFIIRLPEGTLAEELSPQRIEALQARIVAAARSWEDDLADAIRELSPIEHAQIERFADAMPPGYRAAYAANAAVRDIEVLRQLERIEPSSVNPVALPADAAGIALRLAGPGEDTGHIDVSGADELQRDAYRLKIYTIDDPVLLSEMMPVLQNIGMQVLEVNTFDFDVVDPTGRTRQVWIYDFTMTSTNGIQPRQDFAARFNDTVAAAWNGVADSDPLNALVPSAGLTWREVALLRAYVRYQRLGGMNYSKSYIEQALLTNASIACSIVALFDVLFDPQYAGDRTAAADQLRAQIREALADVASLEQDRILTAIVGTVEATLRTDFFQLGADGLPQEEITLKLDPTEVPDLPAPRPYREIWVYSPRLEGVHLRYGPIARGGLRWSDRFEDMRTEVLGLVKAQMVKNTVIVPTGAKGGFLPKRLPDPSQDRDAWMAEGIACYRRFIRAMLRITDNRVGEDVVPPQGVVRRDSDDPYLVVAADKGTATFSDYANEEAEAAGYWLGDAFASGGSIGYDHKDMAITARGGWESVKRHFRELGINTQTTDFTAVGIGDMSGDVFGNGMLRSPHTRLIAAFDHRHIFIDPDPDAATSYVERQRLYDLPRSSWADYDRRLISEGGGVFPRAAKMIQLTEQIRTALGIEEAITQMTPNQLINAVLKAPVDLLWNGGIGTYVKCSSESHADVGDRANDAIRADGKDLRCCVVGEGGNLGFTQLGRVEYALHGAGDAGGKINTDAIDNSAGVSSSDLEVSIKILLKKAIEEGVLDPADRTELLLSMTDEVGDLVLEDNYDQNITLQMEEANSMLFTDAHRRLMHLLEDTGLLDRELELLPSDSELRDRHRAGRGLTSPELAVLLAYSKLQLEKWVLETDLVDDPAYEHLLVNYFPEPLHEKFASVIDRHPLRREIIATLMTNRIVNNAGPTGPMRMMEETGAAPYDVVRAQTAANRIFDLPGLFDEIGELDNDVPVSVQTAMRNDVQRLIERATRWMLRNATPPVDIVGAVERYSEGVAKVIDALPEALSGADREAYLERVSELEEAGVPGAVASRIAVVPKAISALDILDLALDGQVPAGEVVTAYSAIADRLQLSRLLELIIHLPRDGRWRSMARGSLRDDLNGAHAGLTAQILEAAGDDLDSKFESWRAALPRSSEQALEMLEEILDGENVDLASIVVAVQLVRSLVLGTATTH